MGFIFRAVKRLVKLCIKLLLYTAILVTIVVLIPNIPPYTKFTTIELAPPPSRVGPLAPNEALNNAAQRYKGKLLGPEAFQVSNGELYTSLATGEIVKISPGGHLTFVTKIGQPCSGLNKEHICGRPLGFQIDDRGKYIYVADTYHGIWKVDLDTDKKHLLVSPRVEINKRQPKMFNSLALAKNGNLYWTDSSSDMQLRDGVLVSLLDPSGRLFQYDAAKNESRVLADNLWLANGLVLSPDNEFLIISETCRYRLLKHYVAGPKKGQTEVFVNLPGSPDNVRVLPDGSGVLAAMYVVFDEENPLLVRSMATTPVIRKFLARLHRLAELPFEYLNTVYPHVIFEDIAYNIGHFKSISGLLSPLTGLVQIDWNGNIVASYYNTDQTLHHISDGIVYNNELYLGSPHIQDYIGSVPPPPLLKKAFETVKKVETPKVEEKPKKTSSPPKTTSAPTPKSTPPTVTTTPPPPKTTTPPPPKTTTPPLPKTTTSPPPKTTTPPPPKTTSPPPPKTTSPPPPKTTSPPPPKTTTPPPPKTTTSAPKTAPPPKESAAPQPKATPPPTPKATSPSPTPKPTTPSPKTITPPTKHTVSKTEQAKEPPKPATPALEVKTATPPKSSLKTGVESKSTPEKEAPKSETKEQIPIKEEIPSDTMKPPKETLKVIKKGVKGRVPTEIPVPNM